MTHINSQGKFVSDKYVIYHLKKSKNGHMYLDIECSEICSQNKIVLSFNDPAAQIALKVFAEHTKDKELGKDILEVLKDEKEAKI